MGIQGLLPNLKSIMKPIHIKELEGCFVAVDTYSWLHKGALSCSTELCKGQPTTKHIDYCLHRVNMFRHYGVKPILVFDGGPLPMKSEQEIKRLRSRKDNLSRAMEHESNGNLTAAYECYQKAVDISPSVAYELIQVLKKENVSYIVAPYEADAQMAFLALNKYVEAVVTEDSDLIVFGCSRIIYKMDRFGQGVEFKNSMLQHNKELNFAGFTQAMLLEMCILSGCDYLQSLPGLGLKKAYTLMKKFRSHENVIKHLKYNSVEVPPQYEESFKKAILTFKHQRVYDPFVEDIVHLSEPVDVLVEDLDFLGPALSRDIAKGIAQGDIDPFTKFPIQREHGASETLLQETCQFKNFKPEVKTKKLELPAQKNLLTNYFCLTSLEAKQSFKTPRINESTEASSPHMHVDKVKHGKNFDDSRFLETQVHGSDIGNVAANHTKIESALQQNAVCKPCILFHKDFDSDLENGKTTSGHRNKIVRSRYFMKDTNTEQEKKSKPEGLDKNGRYKLENVISNFTYKPASDLSAFLSRPFPALIEGKKEKERLTAGSSYFGWNREDRKHRLRSSYFDKTFVNKNNEKCESEEDLVCRGEAAAETCNFDIHQSLPSNNSPELTRKRKLAHTDSPTEEPNDNNQTSGTFTWDLEEETKFEEEKFSCNISHLEQYSKIADKSLENFAAVISSFRYNSGGSRASGLRPPLKDIKNNVPKRPSKLNMDLRNFVYTRPTKEKTAQKTNV